MAKQGGWSKTQNVGSFFIWSTQCVVKKYSGQFIINLSNWDYELILIELNSQGSKWNQFGILPLKFIFGNDDIDTSREVGCVVTLNNINHINCCGHIWDEVQKMWDMRLFVANMWS